MQPSGHTDEQPSTYSTVFGSAHPHGNDTVSRNTQVGTGQRIGSHPPGCVCLVTVGHGVVVGLGGSVTMLVVTTGLLVLVDDEVDVDVDFDVDVDVVLVGLDLGEVKRQPCVLWAGYH